MKLERLPHLCCTYLRLVVLLLPHIIHIHQYHLNIHTLDWNDIVLNSDQYMYTEIRITLTNVEVDKVGIEISLNNKPSQTSTTSSLHVLKSLSSAGGSK